MDYSVVLFRGESLSSPAAVAWGGNRTELFAVGADKAVWYNNFNGSQWVGWANLGGVSYGKPTALARNDGRVDVFAKQANGSIAQLTWGDATYGPADAVHAVWQNIGGTSNLATDIGASYMNSTRFYVVI